MAFCLLVEDDPHQRAITATTLRSSGHEVAWTGSGSEALVACRERQPEVVLLDLGLPDTDGLELIPRLLAEAPRCRIIVITARNSVDAAVEALRAGARHYLVKPWDADELLLVTGREARAADFREARQRDETEELVWGNAPCMLDLRRQIDKLAAAPRTPVLLEGATGTGKELIARELHRASAAAGPFVAVNCAAIPGELLESELFGHERGAFTGAEARRRGCVELARDGTLFLDEIGEMSPALQGKLLRFLQDHTYRRLGGEDELSSPSRVVAATHRDLAALSAAGTFRLDLFYRLAVVRLLVPTLAERREDLIPLATTLLARIATSLGKPTKHLSAPAQAALVAHDWPGNVRELRNRLERAIVLSEDAAVLPSDLDLPARPSTVTAGRAPADEGRRLAAALEAEDWNVSRAARRLGVERHWLRYRLAKLGLARPRPA